MTGKNNMNSQNKVLLVRIKTFGDVLKYLKMDPPSSGTKVIVIVGDTKFLRFCLKQRISDLTVYCAPHNVDIVYHEMMKMLSLDTIIDVTVDDLLQACDGGEVYCEYCTTSMEQMEADEIPREDSEGNTDVRLVYVTGDVGLLEVNRATVCLDKSNQVAAGCRYEEGAQMSVLSLWGR